MKHLCLILAVVLGDIAYEAYVGDSITAQTKIKLGTSEDKTLGLNTPSSSFVSIKNLDKFFSLEAGMSYETCKGIFPDLSDVTINDNTGNEEATFTFMTAGSIMTAQLNFLNAQLEYFGFHVCDIPLEESIKLHSHLTKYLQQHLKHVGNEINDDKGSFHAWIVNDHRYELNAEKYADQSVLFFSAEALEKGHN